MRDDFSRTPRRRGKRSREICPTGKSRWLTRSGAIFALLKFQDEMRASGAVKIVKREYRCDVCHGWHLTSLERYVDRHAGQPDRVLDREPGDSDHAQSGGQDTA